MGKRVKVALVVLAVALVGMVVWRVLPPAEPMYKGRTLSECLKDTARSGVVTHLSPQSREAVRESGTKATPILLRMLRAKDTPLKLKLVYLAQRQHIIKMEYIPDFEWNRIAVLGFAELGTNAQSAVPGIIEIANQKRSPTSQCCAICALGGIGPSAKQAVPSLLRWATNENSELRRLAVEALGGIHAEPDKVVPVLIRALQDPNASHAAIRGLGEFGPSAAPAVPALVNFLKCSFALDYTEAAGDALKAIDPEAAAKAGIK